MENRSLLIAVNRVVGAGIMKVRSLERAFGSLAEAAAAPVDEVALRCKDIGPKLAGEMVAAMNSSFADEELQRAAGCHVKIITLDDPEYPERLKRTPLPPLCLYCAGNISLLSQPQIAVVGTRRAAVYGMEQARRFSYRFAEAGLHVLSGLAEGIDSAAHEGAIATKGSPGKTIAAIGAALDCVYPASRKPLARDIVRTGGLVMSEYPFGRHADRKTFPQRNRIVAGLAQAVLVAETASSGGTLLTVSMAEELNRPIYAIPGRLDWPNFAGNHNLLREKRAEIALSPDDILDKLQLSVAPALTLSEAQPASAPIGLSPDELKIYEAATPDGVSLDTICAKTGFPMPKVMSLAISLQMHRKLRPLPGGLLRRV